MIDLSLDDLKRLLSDGRRARLYALDHYEELAAREPVHILYGPYTDGTGANIPGGFTPKRARNLSLKTRKKNYIIYELDSEYKLLRARQVFNSVNDQTYQCFELDGIQYACPFLFNQKEKSYRNVIALTWKDGKPYYSAFLAKNVLIASFFEYVSSEKVLITEYTYNPVSKYATQGLLTDPDAPIGAPNAAAQRLGYEEEPMYTDFSQWFQTEDSSLP